MHAFTHAVCVYNWERLLTTVFYQCVRSVFKMRKQQMRHRLPWMVCVYSVRGYCRAPDTPSQFLRIWVITAH